MEKASELSASTTTSTAAAAAAHSVFGPLTSATGTVFTLGLFLSPWKTLFDVSNNSSSLPLVASPLASPSTRHLATQYSSAASNFASDDDYLSTTTIVSGSRSSNPNSPATPNSANSAGAETTAQRLERECSQFSLLSMCLSCLLWWTYAVYKGNGMIFFVNSVGFLLSLYYNWWYFKLADKKEAVIRNAAITLAIYLGSMFIVYLSSESQAIPNLGLICAITSVIMFASPLLASITDIMRTRSVDKIRPLTLFMSIGSTLSWWIYGISIQDSYIANQNLLGLLASLVQLGLVFVYAEQKRSNPFFKGVSVTKSATMRGGFRR